MNRTHCAAAGMFRPSPAAPRTAGSLLRTALLAALLTAGAASPTAVQAGERYAAYPPQQSLDARGQTIPELYVASRSFQVAVKPANEQSKDARAAELFVTRFPDKGWVLDGQCVVRQENGETRFVRSVAVPADGAYYFTSRGVDAVGAAPAPVAGERAQVKVIADTTPPVIRLTAPAPGTTFRAGDSLRIEWTARDANLTPQPVALEYSADDGRSWRTIQAQIPNSGHFFWRLPEELDGDLMLRASCIDRAGNRSVDAPDTVWKIMPQPKPEMNLAQIPLPQNPLPALPDVTVTPVQPGQPAQPVTIKEAPRPAAADAVAQDIKDPRKASRNPQLDANSGEIPALTSNPQEGRAAYVAYLMAGNLVRQGRLKDSLRYYRTAIDIDPNFDEAWNDMALVFKNLAAYAKADACIVKALALEPESIRYLNTRAGIYQSAGFEILRDPASGEESLARANDVILFAVKTYGQAVDTALRQGRLAECAETYFHLGEICYFANQDPRGARQYWVKVLDLHTPTPNLDEVIFDRDTPQERLTRSVYEKNTELWVDLRTWQSWSREYLNQLNQLESGAAVPTAPFTSSYFQRFANPKLGYNSVAGGSAGTGGPSPQAFGLNQSGNYNASEVGFSTQTAFPGVNGASCPIAGGSSRGDGGGVPWYYNANGQPVAAPTTQVTAIRSAPVVDQQKYFIQTGECLTRTTVTDSTYVPVQRGNTTPTYDQRSMQTQQGDLQSRSLPPQGQWLNGAYGSAPDYTYRTSGSN